MKRWSDDELAREAAREVGQRRRVYPRLVAAGSLSQARADEQIAMMDEIRRRLVRAASSDPAGNGRLL